MAVLRASEAIDDLVQRSVAAARDHKLAAFVRGALRDFGGVARAARFDEFGLDPARRKNLPRLIEQRPSRLATVSGIRVVNQQRVLWIGGHRPSCVKLVSNTLPPPLHRVTAPFRRPAHCSAEIPFYII